MNERERRERIGLGNLNDNKLEEMRKRTMMSFKQEEFERSQDMRTKFN